MKKFTGHRLIKTALLCRMITTSLLMISISFIACSQDHLTNQNWLDNTRMAAKSTVVLNNDKETLPLIAIDQLKIASIDMGFNHSFVFDSLLNKYQKTDRFNASMYVAGSSLNALLDDIKLYNTLVIEVSDVSVSDKRVIDFIKEVAGKKQIIIALFGQGVSLAQLDFIKSPLIWCAQHTPESASFVAQAIFGGVSVNNVLEDNYSENYTSGMGSTIRKIRLSYTVPEEVNINTRSLQGIDAIALEAIREKATPGAVVMVVKDGNVIYNKAFGTHTYTDGLPTRIDDIYDLASVTKISATTLEVMRLTESGQLRLDSTLKNYIGRTRGLDKGNIKVGEVMLHQAGFVPFIPFYQKLTDADHSSDSSAGFPTKVADNYYIRKNYFAEVMWPQMLNSKLVSRGKYVYSDLSMYYMKEVVENLSEETLDQSVLKQFYKPLGMKTAGFNPRNRFPKDQIVPTEDDNYFRKTLLQGYVHDQGAAMVGGVSGHAGLFASTNDLAILYQMLLNRGTYGGKQYFKAATVDLFTAKQSDLSR
ncbi:MAG: serine hydrolase, partial [Daejeonella sp.]